MTSIARRAASRFGLGAACATALTWVLTGCMASPQYPIEAGQTPGDGGLHMTQRPQYPIDSASGSRTPDAPPPSPATIVPTPDADMADTPHTAPSAPVDSSDLPPPSDPTVPPPPSDQPHFIAAAETEAPRFFIAGPQIIQPELELAAYRHHRRHRDEAAAEKTASDGDAKPERRGRRRYEAQAAADQAPAAEVTLKRGERVVTVAERLHISRQAILDFNGLNANEHVKAGTVLKIPPATAETAEAKPEAEPAKHAAAAEPPADTPLAVKVKPGERVATVAERLHIPRDEILQANGLTRTSHVAPGTVLKTPYRQAYQVQKGDTLYAIGHRFNLDAGQLAKLNGLKHITELQPGQTVQLPLGVQDQGAREHAGGASAAIEGAPDRVVAQETRKETRKQKREAEREAAKQARADALQASAAAEQLHRTAAAAKLQAEASSNEAPSGRPLSRRERRRVAREEARLAAEQARADFEVARRKPAEPSPGPVAPPPVAASAPVTRAVPVQSASAQVEPNPTNAVQRAPTQSAPTQTASTHSVPGSSSATEGGLVRSSAIQGAAIPSAVVQTATAPPPSGPPVLTPHTYAPPTPMQTSLQTGAVASQTQRSTALATTADATGATTPPVVRSRPAASAPKTVAAAARRTAATTTVMPWDQPGVASTTAASQTARTANASGSRYSATAASGYASYGRGPASPAFSGSSYGSSTPTRLATLNAPTSSGSYGGPTLGRVRPSLPSAGAGNLTNSDVSSAGRGRFIWPLRGAILQPFGDHGTGQRNDGVDIAAQTGASVKAAAGGEVVYAGSSIPGFGNLVLVKHPGGWVTAYAHLDRIEVRMRDAVSQGEEIGLAGQSGAVDRPQLHFEIRYAPDAEQKAHPVDPALVLPGAG